MAMAAILRRGSASPGCLRGRSRGPSCAPGYSMFYNETVYSSLVRKLTYQPPFDVAQSLITSSANILTLEQGLLPQPGIAITNTSGVSPFYKPGIHANLDARHGNRPRPRLGAELGLHRHERNEPRSLAFAKSGSARHSGGSSAARQADPVRDGLHFRSVRREFHLQRAAGAARSPFYARRFVAGAVHIFQVDR